MKNEDALIEIHWTCGTLDEARKICRYLAQERYVACAQITPWIESIYMWNNQLETSQESRVTLKARLDKYEQIRDVIKQNCSYQVPEITYTILDGGNQEYMDWVRESIPNWETQATSSP